MISLTGKKRHVSSVGRQFIGGCHNDIYPGVKRDRSRLRVTQIHWWPIQYNCMVTPFKRVHIAPTAHDVWLRFLFFFLLKFKDFTYAI